MTGYFYNYEEKRINKGYTAFTNIRSYILILSYWCAISSIRHASLAHLNFGIVSCCYIASVVINSTASYLLFNERINMKMGLGIVVTIGGVIWISLAKGDNSNAIEEKMILPDEGLYQSLSTE